MTKVVGVRVPPPAPGRPAVGVVPEIKAPPEMRVRPVSVVYLMGQAVKADGVSVEKCLCRKPMMANIGTWIGPGQVSSVWRSGARWQASRSDIGSWIPFRFEPPPSVPH